MLHRRENFLGKGVLFPHMGYPDYFTGVFVLLAVKIRFGMSFLSKEAIQFCPVQRHVQSDVTELNGHGLVFDELTNGRAREAHWSLVDAYVRVVT